MMWNDYYNGKIPTIRALSKVFKIDPFIFLLRWPLKTRHALKTKDKCLFDKCPIKVSQLNVCLDINSMSNKFNRLLFRDFLSLFCYFKRNQVRSILILLEHFVFVDQQTCRISLKEFIVQHALSLVKQWERH